MISSIKTYYKGLSDKSMGKLFIAYILVVAALSIPHACSGQDSEPVTQQINALADAYVESYFQRFPEVGTVHNIPEADHSSIRDISPLAVVRWVALIDSLYDRLQLLDVSKLSGTESWVTYGYLREELEINIQTRVCREELWYVDQVNGWQVGIGNLASIQPVGTDSLRNAALQRFGSLPDYIDAHIENLREGLMLGYSSPHNNVKRVLDQLDLLLEGPPERSPLYDPARRDSTLAFREAFARLIRQTINPAIKRYRNFLSEVYLPEARTETALSANPNGAACYRARLREHTTMNVTPEEIHKLGLRTVDSIRAQMNTIESSVGPVFFSSRSEFLEATRAAVAKARAAMPDWFGTLPKADVVVVPTPSYLEASGPGGRYLSGTQDGSRPARFQINLNRSRSRASLEKLSYHEAIPGHHLQQAIALERNEAHPITRYFGYFAFNEGWAHYAESLADEMGIYTSDHGRMVMLRSQLMNAHYLVLDTGLHSLGWTRQQAIDYLKRQMGGNVKNIARIIDNIIIWPGQTTSYMVGYQEIKRLRALAETELGDKFDITQFHDLVLADGSITLPMLQEKIERWISSQ